MRYEITTTNGTFYASDADFPELADLVAYTETRQPIPALPPAPNGGVNARRPMVVVLNPDQVVSVAEMVSE